jgi:hypothetical protein
VRIYDAFPMHDELDLLECRLVELQDIPNLVHVIVEADVTHQDNPKPSYFLDNRERFAPWKDRIVHVWATGLPTLKEDSDPWAREHAQREWISQGLQDAEPDDVVMQSDLDEIPTAVAARNVRPQGFVAFDMTLYCFAVDWQHPERWRGTVAARVGQVNSFGGMRDARNVAKPLPDAGWHLSWLGGREANLHKLGAFCHPEVADRIHAGLADGNRFYDDGWHVDGKKLTPVEVDRTWPRWVYERQCPDNWFRG